MEVLLKKDIDRLGSKDDLVVVKNGMDQSFYLRNYAFLYFRSTKHNSIILFRYHNLFCRGALYSYY